VKSNVESVPGTSELDGCTECPFFRKNSRKLARISALVMDFNLASRFMVSRVYIKVRIEAQYHSNLAARKTPTHEETGAALLVSVVGRRLEAKLLLVCF